MKEQHPNPCQVYQERLLRSLDEERTEPSWSDASAAHGRSCPECRAWLEANARLRRGLRARQTVPPPPGLEARIVAAVLQDRRHRQHQRRVATLLGALAASLLVVLAGRFLWLAEDSSPHLPPQARIEPPPREKPISLRRPMVEAGEAVAALTTRTADETVEPTRLLLPVVTPPLPERPMEPGLPSATQPLDEAGESVSAGLQPVTRSAQRAVDLFLRDLSMDLTVRRASREGMRDEG
jgi:hypothetical protein